MDIKRWLSIFLVSYSSIVSISHCDTVKEQIMPMIMAGDFNIDISRAINSWLSEYLEEVFKLHHATDRHPNFQGGCCDV